jgi:predicted ATPase
VEAIGYFQRALELLKAPPNTPERTQQELALLIDLGVPVILTKGHAALEVERIYTQARQLCEQVGDISQRCQVLLGLRRFHFVRGRLGRARELGERLLALAQSVEDPVHLSFAHAVQGEVLCWLGEFALAREQCEKGISLYDPRQHRSYVSHYGNDAGVCCRIEGALVLWYLGYPDQALRMSREGLVLAQELAYPYSLVFALHFGGMLHQFRREAQATREQVEAALALSAEQGFVLYTVAGPTLLGWALVEQGEIEKGIAQMRQCLTAWHGMRIGLFRPHFSALLAEAYGKAGQVTEGLDLLAEALAAVEVTGERHWEAELYRLQGELLLMRGEKESEVEACFRDALEVARRQSAKSLELRAATSLCRLWKGQGRKREARELLQGTYGWFSEGFDTADLQEAKALLDELSSSDDRR